MACPDPARLNQTLKWIALKRLSEVGALSHYPDQSDCHCYSTHAPSSNNIATAAFFMANVVLTPTFPVNNQLLHTAATHLLQGIHTVREVCQTLL